MLQYPKKTGVCIYIYPNLRCKMIPILKNVPYFVQNLDHSVHASNQGGELFGGSTVSVSNGEHAVCCLDETIRF